MTLDEIKSKYSKENSTGSFDRQSFGKIIKARVRKHTGTAFQYFWASFVLQILVYALLSHVIAKNWYDPMITVPGFFGIILFIPFTVVLMKKFKSMAATSFTGDAETSVSSYVARHYDLLRSFYKFKRRYELVLIPLATFTGTFVTFELYVPGGVWTYPSGAIITFLIALVSCIIVIQSENKKSFEQPIAQLRMLMEEFEAA